MFSFQRGNALIPYDPPRPVEEEEGEGGEGGGGGGGARDDDEYGARPWY